MNGLGADGRVPELLEAGGLSAGCCGGIAAGVLGEVCAEGVEGAEAGAEGHGGLLFCGGPSRSEGCVVEESRSIR